MGGTSLSAKKTKSPKDADADALLLKRKASKKAKESKESKGVSKRTKSSSKDSEKAPKKQRAKKTQEEEPPKRSRTSKKTKKKKQQEESSDDEEAEEEAEVNDKDVADDDQEEVDEVSEDEDDGKTSDDKRKSQVRLKARRRGYRHVAEMSGYSSGYASGVSHLDVATPVLSDAEVIRACQFAPQLTDKPAYASLAEFAERTQLSQESLPKSAAKVIRMSGESYLRRLTLGAMQRASDQQKTRATASMVQSETRPLQRVQKYSFVAPHGLVRFAQHQDNAAHRIQKLDADVEAIASEKKGLLKDQPKKRDAIIAEKAALKLARKKKKGRNDDGDAEGASAVEDESVAKKRKTRAVAP
jgi:hypothetical protein